MIGSAPVCLDCMHYWGLDTTREGLNCAAFPNGIPDAILMGDNNHERPYPGDNGIQFELMEQEKEWTITPF